ncbi:hypothetical protein BKA93DRAFT_859002, partial [Sparassis latifolia]
HTHIYLERLSDNQRQARPIPPSAFSSSAVSCPTPRDPRCAQTRPDRNEYNRAASVKMLAFSFLSPSITAPQICRAHSVSRTPYVLERPAGSDATSRPGPRWTFEPVTAYTRSSRWPFISRPRASDRVAVAPTTSHRTRVARTHVDAVTRAQPLIRGGRASRWEGAAREGTRRKDGREDRGRGASRRLGCFRTAWQRGGGPAGRSNTHATSTRESKGRKEGTDEGALASIIVPPQRDALDGLVPPSRPPPHWKAAYERYHKVVQRRLASSGNKVET